MKLFLLFHLTAVDTLMIVSLFFEVFLLLYFWKMQWILRIGTENRPVNFLGTSFAVFLFCHNLVSFSISIVFIQCLSHLMPITLSCPVAVTVFAQQFPAACWKCYPCSICRELKSRVSQMCCPPLEFRLRHKLRESH